MIRKEPDFQNLLDVLARRPTKRPVLFDFPMGEFHLQRLAGNAWQPGQDAMALMKNLIAANIAAGYDYSWIAPWAHFMVFPSTDRERVESIGMAEGGIITDWESFEKYQWPNPENDPWEIFGKLKAFLPDGMKLLFLSTGGIFEYLLKLVGYERLCMLLVDDPDLLHAIVDQIGTRLYRYYELGLEHETIGAAMFTDDWGFKTQIFLSPEQMEDLILPWHRKIIAMIHNSGRPVILHSCGQLELMWDAIIDDLKYDGKHSYEDTILPVEDAYEKYGQRIAILGGIDMDFLCRSTPEQVYRRCKAMIERTQCRGGYALGTGNSLPDYVPAENYDAMRRAALE